MRSCGGSGYGWVRSVVVCSEWGGGALRDRRASLMRLACGWGFVRLVAGSRRPSLSHPPDGERCSESPDLPGIRVARGLTRVSHSQLGAHLASWVGAVVVRVVFYGYSKVWNRGAPFVFERRSTTRLLWPNTLAMAHTSSKCENLTALRSG